MKTAAVKTAPVKTAPVKTAAVATRQLKLMVRTHTEISQAVCALCGWPNLTLKTGTGLYDGTVHLGDVCKLCLRGGKRGAAMRTRAHAMELRSLAENGVSTPRNGGGDHYSPWLCRYADFLDDVAARLENMTEWLPRPG